MIAATTLWAKSSAVPDAAMHAFTVGDDPLLDLQLLPWDCLASIAHVRMLGECGLMAQPDVQALTDALANLHAESLAGRMVISAQQEDGHTAIEHELVARCGEAGKRIHLGRSRNDQVVTALRLLMRDRLLHLGQLLAHVAEGMLAFANRHETAAMPGHTHMRPAMPSSFGQWAQAHAEAMIEALRALPAVDARLDACPLGAAAGFGVPLPLDRARTAQLLGFSRVQRSVIDVQNSRGRHEQAVLDWIVMLANSLEKLLWDLALYSTSEYGYIALPDEYTTGSSIMPQKKNPDVIELARARCGELRGLRATHAEIVQGLPSSYHRDFQLAKGPLLGALGKAEQLLSILAPLMSRIEVRAAHAAAACSDELYAAHEAYRLVAGGMSFRDAYRAVGDSIANACFAPDRAALVGAHLGGLGQLDLAGSAEDLAEASGWVRQRSQQQDHMITHLLGAST